MISYDCDPVTSGDEALRRLYQYWLERRGARAFPSRSDIDPLDFVYALGRVSIVEIMPGPKRFRYRLVSSQLTDHLGYEMSSRYVGDIHDSLKPVAVASRSNKPIGDLMILNAAFLVDRSQESAFDEKVKEVSRKYEDLLRFKYSGPWPPYNFVNIKLKLEKAD